MTKTRDSINVNVRKFISFFEHCANVDRVRVLLYDCKSVQMADTTQATLGLCQNGDRTIALRIFSTNA